jgi:hypothetical protein
VKQCLERDRRCEERDTKLGVLEMREAERWREHDVPSPMSSPVHDDDDDIAASVARLGSLDGAAATRSNEASINSEFPWWGKEETDHGLSVS